MVDINFIYSLIGTPLGYIMWLLYLVVNNFGVAVILFTIIVKAASFPLTLKQQKNMAVSQLFTPRVQEIQKKYRNNQAKMQEEMAKLQKEGYNPMGGCGPMILVMILLFGVIDVVYKPMTHLEHFEWAESGSIANVKEVAKLTEYTSVILASDKDYTLLLEYMDNNSDDFIKVSESQPKVTQDEGFVLTKGDNITNEIRVKIGEFVNNKYTTLIDKSSRLSAQVISELNAVNVKYSDSSLQGELHAVQCFANNKDAFKSDRISNEIYGKLEKLQDNMIFLGLDLGRTPPKAFDPLIIIPILSFIFSGLQIFIQQLIQKRTMPDMANAGGGATKVMFIIMPFFSLFIAFTVPAGAGFYWGISYLIGIAQSLIMYKFWPAAKLKEEALLKAKEKTAMYQTTATVVDVDEKSGEKIERQERLTELSGKEQKEYYRKRLEEARRADAEKYGEVPLDIIDEEPQPKKKSKEKEPVDTENNDDENDGK